MEGVTLSHIFKPSLSSIRKALSIVDDGCPLEIKAVHVLNTSMLLNVLLGRKFFHDVNFKNHFFTAIVKPIIRSDILNRVHFHPTNMDYEKFYEDCIPKSCLPSNYQGDLDDVDELHDRHRKSLLKLREYFLLEERLMNFEFEDYDFDAESVDVESVMNTKI